MAPPPTPSPATQGAAGTAGGAADIDGDELAAWLRLALTDGVGRDAARRLLAAFGPPAALFAARPAAWRGVVGAELAEALGRPPDDLDERVATTRAWLAGGRDRALWTLGDAAYPAALLHTPDPPLLLFAHGDPAWLARPAIAIVGSRSATAQGLDNARAFARALGDAGLVVVSGLAAGIDGAAHEGALAGRGGTIAVVGTGADRVYPARHRALAHRIVERGLVLSEFLPGTPPLAPNFPQRNRLIAALSQGTLVVEAALQSGSLITARLAAEMGREVFAIPGSIHSPQSRGCHALLRQGAKLVESAEDVLEELRPVLGRPRPDPAAVGPPDDAGAADAGPADDPLLAAMGHDPVTLDALSARTGWSVAALNVKLLELELDGRVARLPGGLFQRRAQA
jgi:DNA processing protein